MSNWRDRTERDAMIRGKAYQSPHETPVSTPENKLLKIDVLLPTVMSVMFIFLSALAFYSLLNSSRITIEPSTNRMGSSQVLDEVEAICKKDTQGNFATHLYSHSGKSGHSIMTWNSKARCEEVAAKLNEQIRADQKEKSEIDIISSEEKRVSPETAIINHYRMIQNKQLDESWDNLSPNFQGNTLGKEDYKKWWNLVEEVKIDSIEIKKESKNHAVVRVNLTYNLLSGRVLTDDKKYISLIWNNERWLIDNKSASFIVKPTSNKY